jgi:hypothetical protein
MKQVLDQYPKLTELGQEAIRRAGITPKLQRIRGGTDGSRLSFMGLPCPNIFAGEHAFHSKLEWVSVQDMHKAVETLVHLDYILGRKILIFYPIKYLPMGGVLHQACKQIAHEHFIYCSLCHIGHGFIL